MALVMDRIDYGPAAPIAYVEPCAADWWKRGDVQHYVNEATQKIETPIRAENEFNDLAGRWEIETANYSSPGSAYLHRDYIAIIAKGVANKSIMSLILNRIPNSGNDWFFALENIAGENPAINAKTLDEAIALWRDWIERNVIQKDVNEVPRP